MKDATITLRYEDYELIIAAKNKALEEVAKFKSDYEICYGPSKLAELSKSAEQIRKQRNVNEIHNLIRTGKL
jgi:hypothetical protein